MQAMILAAGLGTRLKPLTDSCPKALVEVASKPLIQHLLNKMNRAGITDIVVNVHHHADMLEEWLRQNAPLAKISNEREELLDTGGALKHAAPLFAVGNSPILIHNVDILSNLPIQQDAADTTLVVSNRQSTRKLFFNEEMQLTGWHNLQTDEVKGIRGVFEYAFSGIHYFSPALFPLMNSFPNKFSIIDFYLYACTRTQIKGLLVSDLQVLDIGKPEALQNTTNVLNLLRQDLNTFAL